MTAPFSFILFSFGNGFGSNDKAGPPCGHEQDRPARVSSPAMIRSSNRRIPASAVPPLRATFAALCANLVGIGLARFGYTPLIPALIAAGWFAPAAAVYLGAANLAGYLAGALGARAIAARTGVPALLRGSMLLTAASLFACALPLGFAWFFLWRFLSGGTGGVLMALAAPSVMPTIPAARRGLAGGAIFTGVGLGIAASGTLVPFLMQWGLVETWLGLGATALVLTAIAWNGWPEADGVPGPQPTSAGKPPAAPVLGALYLEYALNAVGLVPHMVFLVDFIARDLGRGLHEAAGYWVIFGIGALVGPLAGGHLGDRIGFRTALRLSFVAQALCVALPLVTVSGIALAVSSFVVGAFVPGIVAVTIGRTRELIPGDPARQAAAWGFCTTAFALGQAIAGYGFSFIFAQSDNPYPALFLLGAAALLLALIVDFVAGVRPKARAASGGRAE
jgi:predicted MFS family arabinose efflux permease